ncbi:hypothetical protein ABZ208_08755 [Streptomyces sp. NPDC006208]|uniref:hypothetical protein n=1 Tax=Streptomyces sp. NPDC006208 TaxID=3156734 RepID=UPI0033AA4185
MPRHESWHEAGHGAGHDPWQAAWQHSGHGPHHEAYRRARREQRRRLRHEFRPGRLLAGLCVLTAAVLYGGDAAGAWYTPWYVAFPVVFGGLFVAGVVAWIHYGVRRRRAAMSASRENMEAPASTSGSHAIR